MKRVRMFLDLEMEDDQFLTLLSAGAENIKQQIGTRFGKINRVRIENVAVVDSRGDFGEETS